MLLICILIVSIPSLWFMELMYELPFKEAPTVYGTSFFMISLPTFIIGDITSWQLQYMGIGAYLGMSVAAAFFKFRDF